MITVGPSLGGCHDTETVVGLIISAERLVGGAATESTITKFNNNFMLGSLCI